MWMYAVVIAIALSAGAGVYLSQNTDVALRDSARMEEPKVHAASANNIARYLRRMMMEDPSLFPAVPASGEVAISNALVAMAKTNSGIQLPQGISYFLLSTGDIVLVYIRNTDNATLDDDMLDAPFNRVVQLDGANPYLFDKRTGPIDRDMPEYDPVTGDYTTYEVTDDDPSLNWFRGGTEGSNYDDDNYGEGTGTDVTDPLNPGDPPVGDPVVVPDDEPYDSGTDEGEFGGLVIGDGSDVEDDGEFDEEGYYVHEETYQGTTQTVVTNIDISAGYETIDGPFASFADAEILYDFYERTVLESYQTTNDSTEHRTNLQNAGNLLLVPIKYQLINQLSVERQNAEDLFMQQCDTMNRTFLTDNVNYNGIGVEDEMEAVYNGAYALWEGFASDQECQDDDECRNRFAMSTSTAEELELATTSLLVTAAYCESVHRERREGLPTRAHRGHPDNATALIESVIWLQDYKDRTWWLSDDYVGANIYTSQFRTKIDAAIDLYLNISNYPVPTTENTELFVEEEEEEDDGSSEGDTDEETPGEATGN